MKRAQGEEPPNGSQTIDRKREDGSANHGVNGGLRRGTRKSLGFGWALPAPEEGAPVEFGEHHQPVISGILAEMGRRMTAEAEGMDCIPSALVLK